MITVWQKNYKKYDINVSWGQFESHFQGRKIRGTAPFISFYIDEFGYLGLETIYSNKRLSKLEIGKRTDITKYVSDITIEENTSGWDSIINGGKYSCYITRIDEYAFKIEFSINYKEYFDEQEKSIVIDTNVILL